MLNKMINLFSVMLLLLMLATQAIAHFPVIVKGDRLLIKDPEISRAFYDRLAGSPHTYLIESPKNFDLYINLLVPKSSNPNGRYSANVYRLEDNQRLPIGKLDQNAVEWTEFYEPFAGDTYLKGPEFKMQVAAGSYEIEVFSTQNQGKYVLAVGEVEAFGLNKNTLKTLLILPRLKTEFFNVSALSLLRSRMGIAYVVFLALLILLIFIVWKLTRAMIKRLKKTHRHFERTGG
jgi:hypothetical protein